MTRTLDSEPWRGLPDRSPARSSRSCDAITGEILATIAREVPEYARPLEGRFGRASDRGRRGAAPVRRPDPRPRRRSRAGPRGLRRAWPRRAAPGPHARLPAGRLPDRRAGRLAADRRRLPPGRARRRAADPAGRGDLRLHRRALRRLGRGLRPGAGRGRGPAPPPPSELVSLLLRDPPAEPADLAAAARAAALAFPARVAAARLCRGRPGRDRPAAARRRALHRARRAAASCSPTPRAPAAARRSSAAARRRPPRPRSARRAGARCRFLGAGAAGCARPKPGRCRPGPVRAEDHLADLLLFEGGALASGSPPAGWRPAGRSRRRRASGCGRPRWPTSATSGNAVAMAAEHAGPPADCPYRIARLRELLGDQLDDPDARFELELALRDALRPRAACVCAAGCGRRRPRAARRRRSRSGGPGSGGACDARAGACRTRTWARSGGRSSACSRRRGSRR